MIEFFLLSYEESEDYLFYTSDDKSCLMCINKKPPSKYKVSEEYSYIECIVKGFNSQYNFSDFLNVAKKNKGNKVALSTTYKELLPFYQKHGFKIFHEYYENWCSIGDNTEHHCFALKLN